jgi:molybdate/tungstate transport system substrate-binding protein
MSERYRRLALVIGAVLLVVGLVYGTVRGCGDRRQVIHVAVADALTFSFGKMVEVFEREIPDAEVKLVAEGSVMLLRMQILHPADVVVLADHRLIEDVLRPDDADWLVKFATTEVVVARTQASRFAEEISTDNWPEILLRSDVLVAHPDPAVDPCGYYTRLAWKLADQQHAALPQGLFESLVEKSSAKYQRPDALGVMALLESRAVDYAFVYRCHAVDHHLPYVRLPDAVNLGSVAQQGAYARAQIEVPDYKGKIVTMRGHPIFFGLAISKASRNQGLAERFVSFVLSGRGQEILRQSDIVPLVPARAPAWSTRIPKSLMGSVVVEAAPAVGKPGAIGP